MNPHEQKHFPKEAPIIPKGTYVPSNLSPGQRLKQATSNNPNTMASKEEIIGRLGFGKVKPPASPK